MLIDPPYLTSLYLLGKTKEKTKQKKKHPLKLEFLLRKSGKSLLNSTKSSVHDVIPAWLLTASEVSKVAFLSFYRTICLISINIQIYHLLHLLH